MSIYIPGMEMPKSCWRCTLSQLYEKPRKMLICKITHEEVLWHEIDSNCPLIPVPEHGRLIDADEFTALMFADSYQDFVHIIEQMPIIIQASGADKEGQT